MNHLRRLQYQRPVLFWVLTALAFWVGFQVVLTMLAMILGPFGLPGWLPIVVVLAVLVLIARRQQRSR
jgi:hypothetical protein